MLLTRTQQILWNSTLAVAVALSTITQVCTTEWIPARTPIQYTQEHNLNLKGVSRGWAAVIVVSMPTGGGLASGSLMIADILSYQRVGFGT